MTEPESTDALFETVQIGLDEHCAECCGGPHPDCDELKPAHAALTTLRERMDAAVEDRKAGDELVADWYGREQALRAEVEELHSIAEQATIRGEAALAEVERLRPLGFDPTVGHACGDCLAPDETGWYEARCVCGWRNGFPLPDLAVVVDALMDHAADPEEDHL